MHYIFTVHFPILSSQSDTKKPPVLSPKPNPDLVKKFTFNKAGGGGLSPGTSSTSSSPASEKRSSVMHGGESKVAGRWAPNTSVSGSTFVKPHFNAVKKSSSAESSSSNIVKKLSAEFDNAAAASKPSSSTPATAAAAATTTPSFKVRKNAVAASSEQQGKSVVSAQPAQIVDSSKSSMDDLFPSLEPNESQLIEEEFNKLAAADDVIKEEEEEVPFIDEDSSTPSVGGSPPAKSKPPPLRKSDQNLPLKSISRPAAAAAANDKSGNTPTASLAAPESGGDEDEFQDEIQFDPTVSSGHLGYKEVSGHKNADL